MGVSGSGKTTVGRCVAERLGVPFADGDDFHTPENRARMARGEPLDDADRAPWLDALRAHLLACKARGSGGVLACSALKNAYREHLDVGGVAFRRVTAPEDVLYRRLETRKGHYFPKTLLQSQLDALEIDPSIPAFDTHVGSPEETAAALIASL